MFAWILKMKPENFGDRPRTPRGRRSAAGKRGHGDGDGFARGGRHRVLEETVEQELDAEIVHGGSEVDGRLLAGLHGLEVEGVAGAVEHRELVLHFAEGVVVELAAHGVVIEGGDVDRGLELAAGDALEEVDFLGTAIKDALEGRAVAEGPDDRRGLEAEDVLKFVEEVDRAARGPVALVHEREDGHAAATADLEELAGLRLDAFGGVDDHEGGVHGGEHAVGVLGEILVAGGVEQVDRAAGVVELEDGRTDRDAALFLQLHPVGGGGALVLAVLDGAGEMDGVAVKQELLGQGRLARIGVRDDRKGATAGDFLGGRHGGSRSGNATQSGEGSLNLARVCDRTSPGDNFKKVFVTTALPRCF
jgi:hypothetical protein